MRSLNVKQLVGVLLLISLAMLTINIPLLDEKSIALIIIFASAIYLLIRG